MKFTSYINQAPYFVEDFEPINIIVKESEILDGSNSSLVRISSPIIKDIEGSVILMDISIAGLPKEIVSFEEKLDHFFVKIFVDQIRETNIGSYTISVVLSDNGYLPRFPNTYTSIL